ncbi:Dolichyl pyrophosphate Man9GlcNAc2 alpha-1,3-glucosyltransferase, partial [Fragariocoptes setiger]
MVQLSLTISTICIALLLRYLVSRFPHSGQDRPPLFGDYEAQRHWMEITINFKPTEWYKNSTDNDLQYWGLDYPPLTAYHMLFSGVVSNLFNASWTELHHSRGMDSYEHKLFMRSTVLISDLMSFMPAVIYYFSQTSSQSSVVKLNHQQQQPTPDHSVNNFLFTIFALIYPAQILIDHGHFQYNCVFMGLVIWAVILVGRQRYLSASLIFSLALNYKQMSLYYSLSFFWYLLSVTIRRRPISRAIFQLATISLTVLITFIICWSPFLDNPNTALQVLKRLFPFDRGLFEDKVANIWCSLSVVFKFKQIYSLEQLLRISTLLTLAFSLPSGIHLLMAPSFQSFRYSLINCSLVFFLTSFQVHEKTILVVAVPILLVFREHITTVNWFVLISTFSLQPLMVKDQLMIPYAALLIIYAVFSTECFRASIVPEIDQTFNLQMFMRYIYFISCIGAVTLNLAAMLISPPPRYPDLHPLLNAIYSCVHFIGFLAFFYYKQFKCSSDMYSRSSSSPTKDKSD